MLALGQITTISPPILAIKKLQKRTPRDFWQHPSVYYGKKICITSTHIRASKIFTALHVEGWVQMFKSIFLQWQTVSTNIQYALG